MNFCFLYFKVFFIKLVANLRQKMRRDAVNTELKPTEVDNFPYLFEENPTLMELWEPKGEYGKWMMFFLKSELDEKWAKARQAYNAGLLPGIHSMKVSTAFDNNRASDKKTGVIIFYCGPSSDEDLMILRAQTLLQQMPYWSPNGYMYYKTDEQTWGGTRATGQIKNHSYKIAVPRIRPHD